MCRSATIKFRRQYFRGGRRSPRHAPGHQSTEYPIDISLESLAAAPPDLASGKIVAARLGSGVSLCTLGCGRQRDTSMVFSRCHPDGHPMWGLGCCRISGFFHSQNKNKCHCAPVRRGHRTPGRSRSKGHDRRGREPHRSCRGSVGDSQGAPFGTSTLAMQIRRENITLSP